MSATLSIPFPSAIPAAQVSFLDVRENRLLACVPGHGIVVFRRLGTAWQQEATLLPSATLRYDARIPDDYSWIGTRLFVQGAEFDVITGVTTMTEIIQATPGI